MKHLYLMLLLLLSCLLSTNTAHAQDINLTKDLTFHCSWNESLKPDLAVGAESWVGEYASAAGMSGKAMKCDGKGVSYLPNGNFTRTRGTLSLWFKIDEKSDADHQLIVDATNFRFQIYRKQNQVFFMVGTSLPDKGFKWDYQLLLRPKQVPAGKWCHLVLTWDRNTKVLAVFINGKSAGRSKTQLLGDGPGSLPLTLGKNAPGLYDELAVWSRVLSKKEIMWLYKHIAPSTQSPASLTSKSKPDNWQIEPQLANFNYSDSLVTPGEPVNITIPFKNKTTHSQTMTATLEVLDLWEKPVTESQTVTLTIAAGQSQSITRSYTLNQFGCYKLRVTDMADPARIRDVTSFGVLPAGSPPKHPFFGAHVNATKNMPEMARRLGFSSNRVHNMTQFTWWKHLAPEPDQWDMNNSQVAAYQRYLDLGFTHYGQWFAAPYWAVTREDGSHPQPQPNGYPKGWLPTDEQALRQYIMRSIETFPQITQWEMWNEPYVSMFWNGSPDQYFQMCRIIYQQAKATRPELQIFAQVPYDSPWLDRVLELGLLNYCDGFAFHSYYNGSDNPQAPARMVNKIRYKLKAYGKENLPLINSESGVTSGTFLRGLNIPEYSPEQLKTKYQFRESACMMVQSSVVLMSLDVKARYYYFHQPVTLQKGRAFPGYSTCEITRSPLPSAIAHALLVWQLDSGNYVQQLALADGLRTYLFQRQDGKSVAIVWCEDQAHVQIHPQSIKALNLMGHPLDIANGITIADEPVYLISDKSAVELAQQLNLMSCKSLQKPVTVSEGTGLAQEDIFHTAPDFQVATELGKHRLKPIDLSDFVNMSFADPIQGDGKGGWTDEGPYNDARMITPGKYTWFGVPFEIPGKTNLDPSVITLKGMTFHSGPSSVGPIPVNLPKVRGLFIAHAANWMQGIESEIPVTYIITYADGSEVQLPLHGGKQINNWWFKPTKNELSHAIQYKHPNSISPQDSNRYIRVFFWENPKTDIPMTSITLKCSNEKMTYVLCGITVAQW